MCCMWQVQEEERTQGLGWGLLHKSRYTQGIQCTCWVPATAVAQRSESTRTYGSVSQGFPGQRSLGNRWQHQFNEHFTLPIGRDCKLVVQILSPGMFYLTHSIVTKIEPTFRSRRFHLEVQSSDCFENWKSWSYWHQLLSLAMFSWSWVWLCFWLWCAPPESHRAHWSVLSVWPFIIVSAHVFL